MSILLEFYIKSDCDEYYKYMDETNNCVYCVYRTDKYILTLTKKLTPSQAKVYDNAFYDVDVTN